ncbi:MAG: GNAT family N-acetyltransferase [Oscillospiraceae bacterium]|nr:GNAT family N-acetyltransferase [Oscillospiraceae bacterium]
MSRCNAVAQRAPIQAKGVTVRSLVPDDAAAIVELFCQIDEFKDGYLGHEAEMEEEERLNLCNGGRGYGAFYEGKLISYAQTSAENSLGAMITGVATLPAWRRRGFAGAVVSSLCQMCFNDGMQFLCLFYDNPAAGSIYRQLGFEELGVYTMLRGMDTANV